MSINREEGHGQRRRCCAIEESLPFSLLLVTGQWHPAACGLQGCYCGGTWALPRCGFHGDVTVFLNLWPLDSQPGERVNTLA